MWAEIRQPTEEKRAQTSPDGSVLYEELPAGRSLPGEGDSLYSRSLGMKGAGVRTSLNPTSRGPQLHHCLPLLPADAAGSQQVSHKTLAALSHCSMSLAHAEEAANIRHMGFTLQLLPIAETPQETE